MLISILTDSFFDASQIIFDSMFLISVFISSSLCSNRLHKDAEFNGIGLAHNSGLNSCLRVVTVFQHIINLFSKMSTT